MGKQTKAPWRHTPGPLKVQDLGTHFAVVDEAYGTVVAESVLIREDADLFAAAPDMLEALEAFDNVPIDGCGKVDIKVLGAVLLKAGRAMAKARGEG